MLPTHGKVVNIGSRRRVHGTRRKTIHSFSVCRVPCAVSLGPFRDLPMGWLEEGFGCGATCIGNSFADYRFKGIFLASFTVATYNVHRCVGLDFRRDPGRIAAVIRELDADVVALQEVDNRSDGTHESAQMDYLAAVTGCEAVAGPTIRRSNGHYGNLLLTRWPMMESREINLCVSCREPRAAIDARLSIYGIEVRVIATHLGLAFSERWQQFSRLSELMAVNDPSLLILLGDMNEWLPMSRGFRLLQRLLGRSPVTRSFPSWGPFLALDRIWVRPKETLKKVEVHITHLSRIASDHLPVAAEVEISD
jgi:endonuclease/exonuclease/phosphatase family metal-dependent hydrolase